MPETLMGATELERRMLRGDPSVWPTWDPEMLEADTMFAAFADALRRRGQPGSPSIVHVYTHFPYCESSCNFCMYFHEVPRESDRYSAYADHLVGLLATIRNRLGHIDATHAYMGGGTPSAMPLAQLERYFEAFSRTFS